MNITKSIADFAEKQISDVKDRKIDPVSALGMITGYLRALADTCQITPIEYSAHLYTYGLEFAKLLDQGTTRDEEVIKIIENLKATANKLLD